ncbi:uncharacterized protein LOC116295757 isoform X2 [Actinia tenebrosa]|nr:uncharacterized protein LOC116295757 isoform X2 [Actinia tenebrosa]
MISSSLAPRPSPLRLLHEDQCSTVVRIDCLNKEVRKERLRSPVGASQRICAQLTDYQLLEKVKEIGGYNPLYVAINKTGANKFKDPRTFERERPNEGPKATRAPSDCKNNPTQPPTTLPTTKASPTTARFTEPPTTTKKRSTPYYAKQDEGMKMTPFEKLMRKLNDLEDDDVSLVRRLVKRESKVDNCWSKGDYITGSRNRRINLCGECRLVTQLAGDEMPQFINEVACGHEISDLSGQVAHDNRCYASSGLCAQRVLLFPALKRKGYVKDDGLSAEHGREIYVEEWATSTKKIRAGCKCELYTNHAELLKSMEYL